MLLKSDTMSLQQLVHSTSVYKTACLFSVHVVKSVSEIVLVFVLFLFRNFSFYFILVFWITIVLVLRKRRPIILVLILIFMTKITLVASNGILLMGLWLQADCLETGISQNHVLTSSLELSLNVIMATAYFELVRLTLLVKCCSNVFEWVWRRWCNKSWIYVVHKMCLRCPVRLVSCA